MISNFERKYGKYAVKNLTLYLIAGYVIGYMVSLINPTLYGLLTFNPYMILHGQTVPKSAKPVKRRMPTGNLL